MAKQANKSNTVKRKNDFITALEKSLGIITTACKAVNINRSTYYKWFNSDEKFRDRVNGVSEITLDFGESQLFKQMKEGNPACIIYFLKTKGKKRGYGKEDSEMINNNTTVLQLSIPEYKHRLPRSEDEINDK